MKINEIFDKNSKKTYIIAEIGSNHNQSLQLAFETIDAAKSCGADAVKFQSIDIGELYYDPSPKSIELHKRIDLIESWHSELKSYCDKIGITFFSSPTYLRAIEILEELNVELYKLASAQIGTFPQLVEKVASLQKPTLLSTGIVSYGELEKNINLFKKHKNDKFVILHCNSIYPVPYEKVNLGRMKIYEAMFGCTVGFSDHTEGVYTALAAVSMGARVIEKHFTLSKELPVPDAPISIEPVELEQLIKGIRAVEKSIGYEPRDFLESEEESFKESILYRLVLKKEKQKGEILMLDDFDFKRHPSGIDCRNIDGVLGLKATRELKKGELLHYEDMTR